MCHIPCPLYPLGELNVSALYRPFFCYIGHPYSKKAVVPISDTDGAYTSTFDSLEAVYANGVCTMSEVSSGSSAYSGGVFGVYVRDNLGKVCEKNCSTFHDFSVRVVQSSSAFDLLHNCRSPYHERLSVFRPVRSRGAFPISTSLMLPFLV